MRRALIFLGPISLLACTTSQVRTLVMERLPDTPCTVTRFKGLIGELSDRSTQIIDVGAEFTGPVRTYVYAKVREDTELLLVTDVSQDDRPMLLASMIGEREPTFMPTSIEALRSIARDCAR